MKVKAIVTSMFVLGLVSGSAFAAHQRGDVEGLRSRMAQGASHNTKSGDWASDAVSVNVQWNMDASYSDMTRMGFDGRPGTSGTFEWDKAAGGDESSTDFRLGNMSISVDAHPSSWVAAHGSWTTGDTMSEASTARVNSAAGIAMEEAYVTIGDLSKSPFYMTAGRQYLPFGYYGDPNKMTVSMTQLLSQTNASAITVGYIQPNGFHATGYIFSGRMADADGVSGDKRADVNNAGMDVGFCWTDNDHMGMSLRAGYMYNILDVDAIAAQIADASATYDRHVQGTALHVGGYWNQFDGGVTWINTSDHTTSIGGVPADLRPSAVRAHAAYNFESAGHKQNVTFAYEQTREMADFNVPHRRYEMDWKVDMFKSTDMTFQFTHDKDYAVSASGTGLDANTVKVRLSAGFL